MKNKFVRVIAAYPKTGVTEHLVAFKKGDDFFATPERYIKFDTDGSLVALQDGMYIFNKVMVRDGSCVMLTAECMNNEACTIDEKHAVLISPTYKPLSTLVADLDHTGYIGLLEEDKGSTMVLGTDTDGVVVMRVCLENTPLTGLAKGMKCKRNISCTEHR